jgi:hypothetical protein
MSLVAYPPRDPKVEKWFNKVLNSNRQLTQDRCHAFLHALLTITLRRLEEICNDKAIVQKIQTSPHSRLAILASEFRNRMARGRTFKMHGPYRTKFYDDVIVQAEVLLPYFPRIEERS